MEALLPLLIFWLVCFGVTNIITGGKIFAWLRALLKPVPVLGYWIKCPMCVGLPVGVFWYWLGMNPGIHLKFPWDWVAAGSISSALCWMTRVRLHALGEDEL